MFASSLGGASSDNAKYRVKYTDAAWLGGEATAVNGSSNLVVAAGDNTFELTVDGISSGTVTLPATTYTSNGDIAAALHGCADWWRWDPRQLRQRSSERS